MNDHADPQAGDEEHLDTSDQDTTLDDQADEEGDASEEEDDEEDIEFEGRTFRAPKALKERLSAIADVEAYRAETESQRKAFEERQRAEVEAFQRRQQAQAKFSGRLADIQAVEQRLKGWKEFEPETADEREERREAIDRLTDERQRLGAALGEEWRQHELEEAAQARQAEEALTARFLADLKKIDGWSDELGKQVFAYAQKSGFDPAELAGIRDARVVDHLRKSMLYDQQQAQRQRTRTIEQNQSTQPAPKVGAKKAPPAGLSDKLSTAEWARRFTQQRQKWG